MYFICMHVLLSMIELQCEDVDYIFSIDIQCGVINYYLS
jgi:hypothetical protein